MKKLFLFLLILCCNTLQAQYDYNYSFATRYTDIGKDSVTSLTETRLFTKQENVIKEYSLTDPSDATEYTVSYLGVVKNQLVYICSAVNSVKIGTYQEIIITINPIFREVLITNSDKTSNKTSQSFIEYKYSKHE